MLTAAVSSSPTSSLVVVVYGGGLTYVSYVVSPDWNNFLPRRERWFIMACM